MNLLTTPLLVSLSCLLTRFAVPFQYCAVPRPNIPGVRLFSQLHSGGNFESDSVEFLRARIEGLEAANRHMACQVNDLHCQLKKLKEKELDFERLVSMVYETHRRFRHLVAELDLNTGSLPSNKSDQLFQRAQQGLSHDHIKEVFRILNLEAEPDHQFLKEFRNSYAHHCTLDLDQLRSWRIQLQRLTTNIRDADEKKLASAALQILNEIIGFLSDGRNAERFKRHRALETPSGHKRCELGIDEKVTKTRLKKILKLPFIKTNCCSDPQACIQCALSKLKDSGSKLSPRQERRILASKSRVHFNSENPYQDSAFDPQNVLKSRKFIKSKLPIVTTDLTPIVPEPEHVEMEVLDEFVVDADESVETEDASEFYEESEEAN